MKYKIGDRIKIKSKKELIKSNFLLDGGIDDMLILAGTTTVITRILLRSPKILIPYLCDNGYWWDDNWIEELVQESDLEPLLQVGDIVRVKETREIIRITDLQYKQQFKIYTDTNNYLETEIEILSKFTINTSQLKLEI